MNDHYRIHWLTLRFGHGPTEQAFLADYSEASRPFIRAGLLLGLVLYALFGAFDAYIIPEAFGAAMAIRFGIVIPLGAVVFALSYTASFSRYSQVALATLGYAAGCGIVVMSALSLGPGRSLYYAGLMLVGVYIYVLVRLRFVVASIASWALACTNFATIHVDALTPWPVVLTNVTFVMAFNVLGMWASYGAERSAREHFRQRRVIEAQAATLANTLAQVKVLSGLLPICAWCRKVRDDDGYWQQIEAYVSDHTDATFSHGICPECATSMHRDAMRLVIPGATPTGQPADRPAAPDAGLRHP